jgi:hypothetical protein
MLLPGKPIVPLQAPSTPAEREAWVSELGQKADIILVNDVVADGPLKPLLASKMDILKPYPAMFFSAFHPDCCYVGIKATNQLITPHYNSFICLSSFVRGLPQAETVRLFSRDAYARLGFFDAWDRSVDELQRRFTACGMEFRPFFLKLKRQGAFMHSINHPKIGMVGTLARFLALSLSGDPDVLDKPLPLTDGLAAVDWPLYPEIGEIYGVHGAYSWRGPDRLIGVEEYVAQSYARYTELGLTKDSVYFGHPEFQKNFTALVRERGLADG